MSVVAKLTEIASRHLLTIKQYGLGSMGIGMALNLQKHLQETKQPSLHYSNRTLSKGESLMAAGGIEEPNYAALVRSCDIIFTIVSTGHVVSSLGLFTKAADISLQAI